MRRAVLIVVLVGCGNPSGGDPPDGPASGATMDIVVNEHIIRVYNGRSDLTCTCTVARFPAPGECTHEAPVSCDGPLSSCTSCFSDVALEINGVRQPGSLLGPPDDIIGGQVQASLTARSTLVLTGCGQGTTRIDLGEGAFPQPTATVEVANGSVVVRWTSDVPSPSAIATNGPAQSASSCHVAGAQEYAFPATSQPVPYADVDVFLAPTRIDTPLGTAKIWRGGVAAAMSP
jgi:hypothetical protein